jgi:hypothetical protein
MFAVMPRTRTPPRWEQEAPLTPERADELRRRVRLVYGAGVAVFVGLCIALAVVVPAPIVVAGAALFAVADAGTIWLVYRDAAAGIRRNTQSAKEYR